MYVTTAINVTTLLRRLSVFSAILISLVFYISYSAQKIAEKQLSVLEQRFEKFLPNSDLIFAKVDADLWDQSIKISDLSLKLNGKVLFSAKELLVVADSKLLKRVEISTLEVMEFDHTKFSGFNLASLTVKNAEIFPLTNLLKQAQAVSLNEGKISFDAFWRATSMIRAEEITLGDFKVPSNRLGDGSTIVLNLNVTFKEIANGVVQNLSSNASTPSRIGAVDLPSEHIHILQSLPRATIEYLIQRLFQQNFLGST